MKNPEGTVIRQKAHRYTITEQLGIGSKIAETMDDIDRIEREKKIEMDGFKKTLGEAESKLYQLRINNRQGFELRDFECFEQRNVETGQVEFVDVETGEIIDSRPFTSADWQKQLDLFEGGPDEAELRTRANEKMQQAQEAETPLSPDVDSQGNMIPGPNTDAFNAMASEALPQPSNEASDAASDEAGNEAGGEADDEQGAEPDDSAEDAPKKPKRPANKRK